MSTPKVKTDNQSNKTVINSRNTCVTTFKEDFKPK